MRRRRPIITLLLPTPSRPPPLPHTPPHPLRHVHPKRPNHQPHHAQPQTPTIHAPIPRLPDRPPPVSIPLLDPLRERRQPRQPDHRPAHLQRDVEHAGRGTLVAAGRGGDDDDVCGDVAACLSEGFLLLREKGEEGGLHGADAGDVEDGAREGGAPVGCICGDAGEEVDAGDGEEPAGDELLFFFSVRWEEGRGGEGKGLP